MYAWSQHSILLLIIHAPLEPERSTLFGLALSNLGVVPAEAPHVYGVVNAYLLPLAVPLLLFAADLR